MTDFSVFIHFYTVIELIHTETERCAKRVKSVNFQLVMKKSRVLGKKKLLVFHIPHNLQKKVLP